ncbi:MAG: LysR family transcriptional regulator [Hyphomicrobiales bacterium]|nr:MAG: LysR family transcriptional regulator [Hyphomicrobiales bacterium]
MQRVPRVSLNAIRVFATVAKTGSLTAAGAALCVTSSAISHQLKKLEDELGTPLLRRGNNSVALTDAGTRLYEEVAPALALVERSIEALRRDDSEVNVQASTSLAVRWLIPSLDRFRALSPDSRVRVETGSARGSLARPGCDVEIRYFREGESAEGWTLLALDASRPVIAPRLLADTADRPSTSAIGDVPAIQRATGNWDWEHWARQSCIPLAGLRFTHVFDTDDAAIHACVAGLGMVLAPPILTATEMHNGSLAVLPGFLPVIIGAYRYKRYGSSRTVRRFCEWLEAEVGRAGDCSGA